MQSSLHHYGARAARQPNGAVRMGRGPEQQVSYNALKPALASAPVLCTFDPTRRAVLTTDASNVAVAAILTQPDSDD
jgi:hypothetical protein